MEVLSKAKTTLFSYIFKQNYNRVFNCLRDVSKTNMICNTIDENYASEMIFTKGQLTWEIGAEFSFVWKGFLRMFFRTEEYTEGPDISKVRWKIYKTEPPTLDYYLTYCLYRDITENFSTMVMEWEYYVEFPGYNKHQEAKRMENVLIFTAIDKYLNLEEKERVQEECIYIESDIKILWRIVSNFKIFQRLVPIICKSVEYNGDIITGTRVTMNFDCKNKAYVVLTIKDIVIRDNLCRLTYECSEGEPAVPKQEIVWTVAEKEGGFCLVSFRHHYQEVLKQDSLIQTSKLKKKILKSLKVIAERNFEIESTGNSSIRDSISLGSEFGNPGQDI